MRYGNPSKKTRVIASTKGHSLEFPGRGSIPKAEAPKGALIDDDGVVYVHVPGIMTDEVAMAGMQPESEIEEKDDPKGVRKPEDPNELRKQVYEAFKLLVDDNGRDTFNANGVPKGQPLEKLLGYPMTNTEVKELWQKYLLDSKEGA